MPMIKYRKLERLNWFQPIKQTSDNTWDARILTGGGILNITIEDKVFLEKLSFIGEESAKKIIFEAEFTSYIDNNFIFKKEVPENRHFINKVMRIKDSLTFENIKLPDYFITPEIAVINKEKSFNRSYKGLLIKENI